MTILVRNHLAFHPESYQDPFLLSFFLEQKETILIPLCKYEYLNNWSNSSKKWMKNYLDQINRQMLKLTLYNKGIVITNHLA